MVTSPIKTDTIAPRRSGTKAQKAALMPPVAVMPISDAAAVPRKTSARSVQLIE